MLFFLRSYTYKLKILRGFEIALGLIFLTSAILKILEINRFCVQIYAYGVISQKEILPWIATITISIEISLGLLFLLSFPLKRLTMTVNTLLLLTFTSLILYAWIFNNLQDCGCFGKIEMGPRESIIKNLILILISIACFSGVNPIEEKQKEKKTYIKFYIPLIITVILTLFLCYQQLQSEQIVEKNMEDNNRSPYSEMKVEIDGNVYDLGQGEYLIALLSYGCDHCIEESPKINDYMLIKGIPKIIALCLEESPEEKEEFINKVQPLFPMYSIGNRVRLFLSLIGKEPPRLVYLKEGKVIKYWDYDLPDTTEIIKVINK
ncbi:MAG: MauE/DoxX family redox-associated membrane protein [Candidatus Hydrogenedens sp.]